MLKAHSRFRPETWFLPGCCAQAGISAHGIKITALSKTCTLPTTHRCTRSTSQSRLRQGTSMHPPARVHTLIMPSTSLSVKCNYLFSFPLLPQLLSLSPKVVSPSPCFCFWRKWVIFPIFPYVQNRSSYPPARHCILMGRRLRLKCIKMQKLSFAFASSKALFCFLGQTYCAFSVTMNLSHLLR